LGIKRTDIYAALSVAALLGIGYVAYEFVTGKWKLPDIGAWFKRLFEPPKPTVPGYVLPEYATTYEALKKIEIELAKLPAPYVPPITEPLKAPEGQVVIPPIARDVMEVYGVQRVPIEAATIKPAEGWEEYAEGLFGYAYTPYQAARVTEVYQTGQVHVLQTGPSGELQTAYIQLSPTIRFIPGVGYVTT